MRAAVQLGKVGHAYNPSTQEAEAGGCQEFVANLGYMLRPYLKTRTDPVRIRPA